MNNSKILMYQTNDGNMKIDVRIEDETVWLTQAQMATLFECTSDNISLHLKNIFETQELDEHSTTENFSVVQKEGNRAVKRNQKFYNLDAIISVGYRVKSSRATQFRIWATKTLKEFIIKGFILNAEMLKNGRAFGKDYFDELLEKIREIRASERRFYEKITDIYAECSADYDKSAPTTRQFYTTVQNKLHWAITGNTAAELIVNRANAQKEHMGLKTWKNAPNGKILKSDVSVAKNYLEESEIKELERVVSMYLDYAENQAAKHVIMKMEDWIKKLDAFLQFNEYDILSNSGKVSHAIAKQLSEKEYSTFRITQDKNYLSDFNKEVNKLKNK